MVCVWFVQNDDTGIYSVCWRMRLYLIGVCSVLVFGAVRGIGESFVTALVLAHVRFLASVRAQVSLQVLQARVCFITAFKLRHTNTFTFT